MYHSSVCDTRNRAFVEIRFGYGKEEWYKLFKEQGDTLRKEIHPLVRFNDKNRSIGFYITAKNDDVQKTVYNLVEVFEKFIRYFSVYTYGRKKIKASDPIQ